MLAGDRPKVRATAAAVDKGMTVSDRMRPIESRLEERDRYSRMSWSSSVCSTCPSDTAFASTWRAVLPMPIELSSFQTAPELPESRLLLYSTHSRWRWNTHESWRFPAARRSERSTFGMERPSVLPGASTRTYETESGLSFAAMRACVLEETTKKRQGTRRKGEHVATRTLCEVTWNTHHDT